VIHSLVHTLCVCITSIVPRTQKLTGGSLVHTLSVCHRFLNSTTTDTDTQHSQRYWWATYWLHSQRVTQKSVLGRGGSHVRAQPMRTTWRPVPTGKVCPWPTTPTSGENSNQCILEAGWLTRHPVLCPWPVRLHPALHTQQQQQQQSGVVPHNHIHEHRKVEAAVAGRGS
jgi:hypothetical protein